MAEPDKKAQQDIHLKIKANKNHSFFTSVLGLKKQKHCKASSVCKNCQATRTPFEISLSKKKTHG